MPSSDYANTDCAMTTTSRLAPIRLPTIPRRAAGNRIQPPSPQQQQQQPIDRRVAKSRGHAAAPVIPHHIRSDINDRNNNNSNLNNISSISINSIPSSCSSSRGHTNPRHAANTVQQLAPPSSSTDDGDTTDGGGISPVYQSQDDDPYVIDDYTKLDVSRPEALTITWSRCACWSLAVMLMNFVVTALIVFSTLFLFDGVDGVETALYGNNDRSTSATSCGGRLGGGRTLRHRQDRVTSSLAIDDRLKNFISGLVNESLKATVNDPKRDELHCATHLFLQNNIHCSDQVSTEAYGSTALTGWSDSAETSFARPCLPLDSTNRGLNVTVPGVYLVYTHLAFCRNAQMRFEQQLMLQRRSSSGAEPKVLVLAEDRKQIGGISTSSSGAGESVYTGVLFAIIRLQSHDSIWIEANPAISVYSANRASFWGLFLLDK